jgi:hypothetical protein
MIFLRSYALMLILSLGIAAYALFVYTMLPLGRALHPDMRHTFETYRWAIYTHIFASIVALALGPFQFSAKLRSTRMQLHRWLGRLYLAVGVGVGGIAGLFMSFHAFGGLGAKLGFLFLALGWLYTGFRAYVAIRAKGIASHKKWMIRNFSLTFAAVTLRIWLGISFALNIPMEISYPVIAWLCWVPNIVLAELILNKQS